jgi:hypothetical protein
MLMFRCIFAIASDKAPAQPRCLFSNAVGLCSTELRVHIGEMLARCLVVEDGLTAKFVFANVGLFLGA